MLRQLRLSPYRSCPLHGLIFLLVKSFSGSLAECGKHRKKHPYRVLFPMLRLLSQFYVTIVSSCLLSIFIYYADSLQEQYILSIF
jgi:hypothetical protein